MWPEWLHWTIAVVPSLTGAVLGVFLPSRWTRLILGWLGAIVGFGLGVFASLILDPPLLVEPGLAVAGILIGSAIYGTGTFVLVLCFWWLRKRTDANV